MIFAYADTDKHNWTKAELEAYDYVLMREQEERGLWALATRKTLENVAIKLIKRNLSNEEISFDTGLTIEQVEKLRTIFKLDNRV